MCEISIKMLVALIQLISLNWITTSDGAVSVPHGSYVVLEGNKLSINCSVTGEEIIGWFTSGGQEITSNPSERVHVRTDGLLKYLEISNVNKADRGVYECRGSKNNTRVMLYVEYSPVFITESSTHKTIFSSVDNNEEITLNCAFDGYPVPQVKFQFAGFELNGSVIRPGFVSYKFRVKSQSDFGFYTCVATNKMGRKTHFIEVYERGAPEPPNNVQGSATCGSIEVTWEASRKDGGSPVTGYTIELRIGGETVKSKSLSHSSRATSFTNLKQKTQYEVRLNSNNALGDGEWRSISLNTTVACTEKHLSSASKMSVVTQVVTLLIIAVHMVL